MSAKILKKEDRGPDLEKICRLCLAEDCDNTVNIFSPESTINVPLRIMACAALEVHSSDPLPKQICRSCRIQLERSYYFRKNSQLSEAKLRKHMRLINAGKVSRVFEPKSHEDDDDDDADELKDSLNFLKEIDREEHTKQLQRDAELEETVRQQLRQEEMDRIFEEAKNFFSSKISNKPKRCAAVKRECNLAAVVPGPCPKINTTPQEDIFGCVADSTEVTYTPPSTTDENISGSTCYVVKVGNASHEEEFDIENARNLNEQHHPEKLNSFTVVKVEVGSSQKMDFQTLDFEQLDNSETAMEQDSDEYNEEQVSLIDDNSENSNVELYAISAHSDTDQDANPHSDHMGIELVQIDNNEEDEGQIEHLEDDETKSAEYLDDNNQMVGETAPEKPNPAPNVDLIEVNNPANADELKIFKCTDCPQAFTRRAQLLRHTSVHEKIRGYQCEHCRKWFACKSSMDRHSRIHTGEKPFECKICHRRFIQKEILKRHFVIHTGNRPFPCPHCDKAFVQRQMLTQHINLKHTDNPVVQMHECFLCPKSFCHASGLSRHLLTHSGVTYSCKICDKKFSDKSAVKRHTSTVH